MGFDCSILEARWWGGGERRVEGTAAAGKLEFAAVAHPEVELELEDMVL